MKFFMVSALATALALAAMANPLASIDSNVEAITPSDIDYDESNAIFDNETTTEQPEDYEAFADLLASIDSNVETGTTFYIDYDESIASFDNQTTTEQPEDSEALTLQRVPGYDPPIPRPGCKFFPETSKVVAWDEVEEQVCVDSVETGCGSCITDLYQIGFEGLQIKGFQNCSITYHAETLELSRVSSTTQTETVCRNIDEKNCQFRWVKEDNGDKTWKEDPNTCTTLQVTKCEEVPKTTVSATDIDLTVQIPDGICCDVVRDDCHTIHQRVPRQQEVTTWKEVCPLPDH